MIVPLLPLGEGDLSCGNSACGVLLNKCHNYVAYNVCNRCLVATSDMATDNDSSAELALCDCCRFTRIIPDLSVPGNLEKWYRLEAAKRRLFYDLDLLGLPYGTKAQDGRSILRFDFKADINLTNQFWQPLGIQEQVFTGHADGIITINIREADDAERERLRVELGEAKRTLLRHFRHEIGHYYWDMFVKHKRETDFNGLFGDPTRPSYQDALKRYYETEPPADWQERFVSVYATMHPWEDFAETFATYLDMVSLLETAYYNSFSGEPSPICDLDTMVKQYQRVGIALNELNRSMGTLDVVPEVFTPVVKQKMHFVHQLTVQEKALPLEPSRDTTLRSA
jgi:hypothetical protein